MKFKYRLPTSQITKEMVRPFDSTGSSVEENEDDIYIQKEH